MIKIIIFLTLIIFSKNSLAIQFNLPLRCQYQKDCFIQHYVDNDFNNINQYQDYNCGVLSYNQHKGTDFRIKNLQELDKNYEILAAADGIVIGIRNNAKDYDFTKKPQLVKNIECGNGVTIKHEEDFETQYCHLKRGTLIPKIGQKIKTGDKIGIMGMSGKTEFPHLHFTVRKNDQIIDPFSSNKTIKNINCNSKKKPLWKKEVSRLLEYFPITVLDAGFSNIIPSNNKKQRVRELAASKVNINNDKLIFWLDIIGIKKNDILSAKLKDKNQKIIAKNSTKFTKNKAQYFQFIGKKNLKLEKGSYSGEINIIRDNKVLFKKIYYLDDF